MTWRVTAETLSVSDTDGSTLRVTQRIIARKNFILKAIRVGMVAVGDPTFTDISYSICADRGNMPAGYIADSTNVRTKVSMMTQPHGVYFFHMAFDNILLRKDQQYHFVPFVSAYAPSDTSLLLWKAAWPDPVYKDNVLYSYVDKLTSPYEIILIGSEV